MTFAELATGGDQPKVADLANQLLIIEPTEYKPSITTVHGDTDAIEVNVTNLDTGEIHEGLLFFNVALKNALKNKVGQKVLARIGQGTAKPGKSAPWILIDATSNPADLAKANAFVVRIARNPMVSRQTTISPAGRASVTVPSFDRLFFRVAEIKVTFGHVRISC